VSTSANLAGAPSPKNFQEISPEILKGVDYIVPLEPENNNNSPSTIIKLSNSGLVKVIRP
jgi:L-threonylcarbamoyladenylate synthase